MKVSREIGVLPGRFHRSKIEGNITYKTNREQVEFQVELNNGIDPVQNEQQRLINLI